MTILPLSFPGEDAVTVFFFFSPFLKIYHDFLLCFRHRLKTDKLECYGHDGVMYEKAQTNEFICR